jgi:2-polyprenyl-6-methoxyphenol hydroxylase-like FAD-dependent oxidoreductase
MTSTMTESTVDTDVLIVGAGPVGLALGGDLGWRGKRCIIVERGDGSIYQPKMDMVGIRTMEFCRRWGIVGQVEASPYDRDYPQDNVYLTSLNGYELGRQPMPSMRDEPTPPESPQHRERCPQNMFDPILCSFAASQSTCTLLYRHELLAFEQDDRWVTARIRTLESGDQLTIRAKYLVGCDGGKSRVREQLRIPMHGRGVLTYTTNVIFRCAGFNALHDKRPGYRYLFIGPNGVWGTMVAINGKDQWRMSIIGSADDQREYAESELKGFAYRMLGRPFDMDILSILPWVRTELVAERYGEGRVFICGDACHLTSPTGGLGMNTGIADSIDLAWKLAAMLDGWGGAALLDSYGIERKPIAERITRFSTGNLMTMKSARSSDALFEESEAGRAVRSQVGNALMEGMKREWFCLNMHLGYRYLDSPICVYGEPEDRMLAMAELDEPIIYRPTSRPGCRAPHAWLRDGRSILDLFGRGFVLLTFDARKSETAPFIDGARQAKVPMEVAAIDDPAVRTLYEKRFVLVRPDGHVAWRGDALPADTPQLIDTITGRVRPA